MSVYNVPFTSSLQMWSPSSSIDYNFNITTATEMPFTSTQVPTMKPHFFHHEPVLYPSACMICGLLHHPVPQTVMQQYPTESPIMTTPAPLEPTLPPSIPKVGKMKRKRVRNQPTLFTKQFKAMSKKFARFFTFILKAPLVNRRRHNIYPVKRDRLD
ncbi:unnamed protein product [Mucor hiemalis]